MKIISYAFLLLLILISIGSIQKNNCEESPQNTFCIEINFETRTINGELSEFEFPNNLREGDILQLKKVVFFNKLDEEAPEFTYRIELRSAIGEITNPLDIRVPTVLKPNDKLEIVHLGGGVYEYILNEETLENQNHIKSLKLFPSGEWILIHSTQGITSLFQQKFQRIINGRFLTPDNPTAIPVQQLKVTSLQELETRDTRIYTKIILILTAIGVLGGIVKHLHGINTTKKKDQRPLIIDQVQKVISPFIDQITREIEILENGGFSWDHTSKFQGLRGVRKLIPFYFKTISTTLRDVYSENKGLKKKIDKHNQMIPKLEEKLMKLDDKILTPKFIKLCKEKAKVFNKKNHDYPYKLQERELMNIHFWAVKGIINNEGIFHRDDGSVLGLEMVFWNDFREEFLKIREEKGIKDDLETGSILGDAIRKTAEEIKDNLEEIMQKYRKKYNLTQDELISNESSPDFPIPY